MPDVRKHHVVSVAALACALALSSCGDTGGSGTVGVGASTSASSDTNLTISYAIPAAPVDPDFVDAAPVNTALPAYVDTYYTNVADNACYATVDTNASVRALKGMLDLWTPATRYVDAQTYGTSGVAAGTDDNGNACAAIPASKWDGTATTGGTILDNTVLAANIQYVIAATKSRTDARGQAAWRDDAGAKNFNVAEGVGRLATAWRAGLGTTSDYDYANDSVTKSEGSSAGTLGKVFTLTDSSGVGAYATGNTSKYFFKYQRPYKWSSSVVVEPKLVNNETAASGSDAAKDAGFASGHTAEAVRRAAAMAYALPERFQELYARALELGENRILAGMHSPLDVIGGRIVGLAAAAANLYSEENASLATAKKNAVVTAAFKSDAYTQAHTVLQAAAGTTGWKAFFDYLHSGQNTDSSAANYDRFADHDANLAAFERRMTLGMSGNVYSANLAPTVPKGAEVLLETRYPYLTADQRRVVLKTTAFASGYPVMTDAEGWGRLDMFRAGDGYGQFNGLVTITMTSSLGGFAIYDIWRNDITGTGKLKFLGDGTLRLAGKNSYSGGTEIRGGALDAGSAAALGTGDVYLAGGSLLVSAAAPLQLGQKYTQLAGTTLQVTIGAAGQGRVDVGGLATIQGGTLNVAFASGYTPSANDTITILTAGSRYGAFTTVSVAGWNATTHYGATGVTVTLTSKKS